MRLAELFKNVNEWEWIEKTSDEWLARFNVGDLEYHLMFAKSAKMKDVWEVSLALIKDGEPYDGIEGTGNAMKVFSTAIGIINSFRQNNPNITVKLAAREPSRRSLYTAIANRLSPSSTIMANNSIYFIKPGD